MEIKNQSIKTALFTIVIAFCGILNLNAQSRVRQSPKMVVTGKINEANITITYGSPSVKGRKIWGELVPYNKIWRTGANEATQIETDKDLMVEGKKLVAGKYTLYTIPGEKEWKIIISSQTGQWGIERSGETTHNPEKDVIEVAVNPVISPDFEEALMFVLNKNHLVIKWEHLQIPISIQ